MRLEEMPDATPDMRLRRADGTVVPFLLQSTLIRRDVWHALGGMDLRRVHGEDVDFYLRLTDAGIEAATIDATTLIYRLHGQNRSRVIDVGLDAMLMTMRAAIERRRAQRVG